MKKIYILCSIREGVLRSELPTPTQWTTETPDRDLPGWLSTTNNQKIDIIAILMNKSIYFL